jgi:AraC-like DNA-binding protein
VGSPGDLARTIARLAVPALGDVCVVGVLDGPTTVRRLFAHRDPTKLAAVDALLRYMPGPHEFPEGRRALAGESLLFRLPDAALRLFDRNPPRGELIRRLDVGWAMHFPLIVMGRTVAVAGFARTAESGVPLGTGDLALAEEMVRHVIGCYAGFRAAPHEGHEDVRLRRVEAFITSNLGASLSLEAMARRAGLSRFHFLRLFRDAYGETPFRRVRRLRMQEAQRRLARGAESITEIAFACGYENSAHFASAFRRALGVSPSVYRRQARRRPG